MIIASSLPQKILSTNDILKLCECPIDFQINKLGITSRHILSDNENALDLSTQACEKLFSDSQIDKNSIDCLIYVTQSPEKQIPQNSSLLQNKLQLPSSIFAFDIALGCSGFVYALSVAKALIASYSFKNALIVTCDCYSKLIDKSDKNTMAIFGDAATATYITNKDIIGITDHGTDGSNAQAIMLDENHILRMNGRSVFEFAIKIAKKTVINCLEKNNLTIQDIDYFVFHQANKFMVENIANLLNLPNEKVILNLENYANTISSSIPLALEPMVSSEQYKNKKILICGFGVGLSWATNIITL